MTGAPAERPTKPPEAERPHRNLSALAAASPFVGLTGFCTSGIGSLAGLALGIVGLVHIARHRTRLTGSVLAMLGIAISGLGIAFVVASWSSPPPMYAVQVQDNLATLCKVAIGYAWANEGRLPPADTWPEVLVEEKYLVDGPVFTDPGQPEAGRAYAMNANLAGRLFQDIPEPGRTVLFFECAIGSPPSGGPELLPDPPRHRGGHLIGLLDRHVEWIGPDDLDRLLWAPEARPITEAKPRK